MLHFFVAHLKSGHLQFYKTSNQQQQQTHQSSTIFLRSSNNLISSIDHNIMRGMSASIQYLAVCLLVALSGDKTLQIFASPTKNATASESSPSNPSSTGSEVPLQEQRGTPCYDRSPYCKSWASAAECRKKNARNYMRDNCPYSCNLCNPLLVPWEPRPQHYLCTRTFDSQVEMGVTIFTGGKLMKVSF